MAYGTPVRQCPRAYPFFMGFPEIVLLLWSWLLLKIGSGGHATQICDDMPYFFVGEVGLDRCSFYIKNSFFLFFGQKFYDEI